MHYASEIGQTPPMVWSAYMEYEEQSIAKLLIDRGIDVNAANTRGETALTWAEKRKHEHLIALLKAAGAQPSAGLPKKKDLPNRHIILTPENEADLVKESSNKSVSLMLQSSDAFLRNRNFCVSCHSQNLPAAAAARARDRGLAINDRALFSRPSQTGRA